MTYRRISVEKNLPINWVGVIVMFVAVMGVLTAQHSLTIGQVTLLLEPMDSFIKENAQDIQENKDNTEKALGILTSDVRVLVRDTAVQGEQIKRIDQFGSSSLLEYKKGLEQ